MYRKVDSKLDFVGNEEKVLKFWKENKIIDKALKFNVYAGERNGMPVGMRKTGFFKKFYE